MALGIDGSKVGEVIRPALCLGLDVVDVPRSPKTQLAAEALGALADVPVSCEHLQAQLVPARAVAA